MNLLRITPEAAKLVTDEELYSRISSDETSLEDWEPRPDWIYLGVFNPELIGYFMLHIENDNMLSIHINIKKEHRKHGKEAALLFLDEFKNNFDECAQKLTCRIPVIYPEVFHFCLNLGFEDEGLCKRSIMKNGKLVDQHILGLQRAKL